MKRQEKQTNTQTKLNTRQAGTGRKRNGGASTQKKAGQTSGHRCRVKKENSTSLEVSAEQIDPSSPEADAAVMQALLQMAVSGRYITATIFWAKVRCGMGEKGRGKGQGASGAPSIVIRTEEGKKA